MSHKVYRLCLLSVAVLAIIGGIFYYLNYSQKNQISTEGTLVYHVEGTPEVICHEQGNNTEEINIKWA